MHTNTVRSKEHHLAQNFNSFVGKCQGSERNNMQEWEVRIKEIKMFPILEGSWGM
jgi:hypothetical protein